LSTPSLTPDDNSGAKTFAETAEERFFTLDHVGVVRHIEGYDLQAVIPVVRQILQDRRAKFEDAIETVNGIAVYTNVASLSKIDEFTLWVKASQFEGVGVLLDVKVFHTTERSAKADEELSRLVAELEDRVAESRRI